MSKSLIEYHLISEIISICLILEIDFNKIDCFSFLCLCHNHIINTLMELKQLLAILDYIVGVGHHR